MKNSEMVHSAKLNVKGETYHVEVYCRNDGKHRAKVFLGDTGFIINEGDSLEEAMKISGDLLPHAVNAHRFREIMKKLSLA